MNFKSSDSITNYKGKLEFQNDQEIKVSFEKTMKIEIRSKDDLITDIYYLLHHVDNVPKKVDKIKYCEFLFELLCVNKWFLHEHENFSRVCQKKITDLKQQGWANANAYGRRLFPENIQFVEYV